MFGESGFTHGDLLRGHNQYAGRSLKVNGADCRDTYNESTLPEEEHALYKLISRYYRPVALGLAFLF
ncbi:hypothetical protein BBY84_14825 [Salmonella enterica]|nr:hypothetical protein [Salmonella enterica]ECI8012775.1 hypothetical protein [Salmonella enterica subsp. enterica]